jgi:hypothetical protein
VSRLLASVVLVAVALPVGGALADSVGAGVRDCQYVQVYVPDQETPELRVCRPDPEA